jgi:hypothetical protein
VAEIVGITTEVLRKNHTPRGIFSGVGDTKDGRRDMAVTLAGLKDKDFETAEKAGFVKVLGQAWGVKPARIIRLRASGYPTPSTAQSPAPAKKSRKAKSGKQDIATMTPEQKRELREVEEGLPTTSGNAYHSHDGKSSHPVATAHRS